MPRGVRLMSDRLMNAIYSRLIGYKDFDYSGANWMEARFESHQNHIPQGNVCWKAAARTTNNNTFPMRKSKSDFQQKQ